MEFKYSAIDNKPQPSAPHPASAVTFLERSLGGAGGSARMVDPPLSPASQRELEKLRIRQEIIAEEMARARRQELEKEVRRELELEGILMQGSMGPPERFLLHEERVMNLNSVAIDDNMPPQQQPQILGLLNEIEPNNQQDPPQERVNLRLNPKLNQVAIEDFPQPFILLAKPDRAVYEAKRKAAEPAVNDFQFGLMMKKAKKEWRCALCGVSTTDEGGLNAHLRGRKHKAKEAIIEVEKIDKSTSLSPSNLKVVKSTETETMNITTTIGLDAKPDIKIHHALGEGSMIQNSGDTTVATDGVKEEVIVQKSQNVGVSGINGVTAEEAGKTNVLPVLVGRNVKFWCNICGISTLSQVVMEGHKKGRKHRRRMEIAESQSNGIAPPTSPVDNFLCSEKVHPISGSYEDNVGEGLCAANTGHEKST